MHRNQQARFQSFGKVLLKMPFPMLAEVDSRYERIRSAFERAFAAQPDLYARAPGACQRAGTGRFFVGFATTRGADTCVWWGCAMQAVST